MKSRRILYWALQIFGWGAYFGWYAVIVALYANNRPFLHSIPILALFHIAASHGIRSAIRRWNWLALPVRPLIIRSIAVCLVFAALLQLAFTPVAVAFGAATWRQQFSNEWIYGSYSFVLFLLWTALYLLFEHVFLFRESEFKRLRLEASLREAELSALRSQVNPHFMFNCLNNVRSLVAEDSERAREMLLRLSELLRYALEAGKRDLVPLGDELHVVSAYLELEKLQFEERLSWSFDIAQNAVDAQIPPMLLQQLVENAVKHGIAPSPSGGEIRISARIEAGKLNLDVENTGQLPATAGTGVGLMNARERLRLLCGTKAALSLENKDSAHVAAVAEVPLNAI